MNNTAMPLKHTQKGVTLIELLITILIMAALLAIAIPSYRSYILTAQRTEAMTALIQAASLQEQFFSENRAYTEDPSELGFTTVGSTDYWTENGYYRIRISVVAADGTTSPVTPPSYSLRALPKNAQADDDYRFWLSSNGTKEYKTDDGVKESGWPD